MKNGKSSFWNRSTLGTRTFGLSGAFCFSTDWQTKDLWRLSYEHVVEPGGIIVDESIDSQFTRALTPG